MNFRTSFSFEKKFMKLLIFRILFLQQILGISSLPKAKYSKCIVEDGGNVEVSGIFEIAFFTRSNGPLPFLELGTYSRKL